MCDVAALRVYTPDDWEAAGLEGLQFMEQELKRTLEGMAKHLFGDVEVCGRALV